MLNGPPNNQVDQINLKYVNTQRATLTGFEASAELDLTTSLSAFGTASYVEGQDHTRNGQFATMESGTGTASQQVRGMRRGAFSGLPTPSSEPLPQLPPLQSRLGLRLNGKRDDIKWQLEVSARVIDNQSRIARSLAESTTPGFTVWDIRSYWELSENITVVAGVENFTDKDYREHFDFRSFNPVATTVRQPGASFYFGSLISY